METVKLSLNELGNGAYTHCFEIGQRDLTGAPDLTQTATNTTQDITLLPAAALPAGSLIKSVAVWLREAFENTGDAAFNTTTMSIGTSGAATSVLSAQELNVNGTEITTVVSNTGVAVSGAALIARFSSRAAKALASLNRGRVVIAAELVKVPQLAPR